MFTPVDFRQVSAAGLTSSPVAEALAGLRAHEARYFHTKYRHTFAVAPAAEVPQIVAWLHQLMEAERGLRIASPPLEATSFAVEGLQTVHVFYQSGLAINAMLPLDQPHRRAVGFKLSVGMEIPEELAPRFKFATMKSALAGLIRGSFFVIKGQHPAPPLLQG